MVNHAEGGGSEIDQGRWDAASDGEKLEMLRTAMNAIAKRVHDTKQKSESGHRDVSQEVSSLRRTIDALMRRQGDPPED